MSHLLKMARCFEKARLSRPSNINEYVNGGLAAWTQYFRKCCGSTVCCGITPTQINQIECFPVRSPQEVCKKGWTTREAIGELYFLLHSNGTIFENHFSTIFQHLFNHFSIILQPFFYIPIIYIFQLPCEACLLLTFWQFAYAMATFRSSARFVQ